MIALVLGVLFTTSAAFSEVETYEDAIPVLKETGEKLYQTLSDSIDYVQGLIELWATEIEN